MKSLPAKSEPVVDRWVNAVIEVVIPLDVPVTATKWEKQEAASKAMELVSDHMQPDWSISGHWENAAVDSPWRVGDRVRVYPESRGVQKVLGKNFIGTIAKVIENGAYVQPDGRPEGETVGVGAHVLERVDG